MSSLCQSHPVFHGMATCLDTTSVVWKHTMRNKVEVFSERANEKTADHLTPVAAKSLDIVALSKTG